MVVTYDSYVPSDDGRWVHESYERLARVVQDYSPQFELRWIPPEFRVNAEDRKKPYVVWDLVTNSPVLYASELDTPEQILARLFEGDNTKHNVLETLDKLNAAQEALDLKKKMDQAEERQDLVAHLVGNKNNYIKLPGGRKVDDQLRPIL